MATSEIETESREARIGADPDGEPVVSIVLSADQLDALGVNTSGETVTYRVEDGELRFD
jgi:hypothetical protein